MKHLFFFALMGEGSTTSLSIPDMILNAGLLVKVVMLLLLTASIICWTIIFWKLWLLKRAGDQSERFSESFWAAGSLEGAAKAAKAFPVAPMSRIFEGALQEFNSIVELKRNREDTLELLETNVQRTLQKVTAIEIEGLNRWITFLASTAATAPFIGLFGTVWGIMTSFINIGATGASNLGVVAPGIAEALIATAMGLFAAIPAALFYNYFVTQIRGMRASMNYFGSDFMNTAKRSVQ